MGQHGYNAETALLQTLTRHTVTSACMRAQEITSFAAMWIHGATTCKYVNCGSDASEQTRRCNLSHRFQSRYGRLILVIGMCYFMSSWGQGNSWEHCQLVFVVLHYAACTVLTHSIGTFPVWNRLIICKLHAIYMWTCELSYRANLTV
jgi:hypothetical protein